MNEIQKETEIKDDIEEAVSADERPLYAGSLNVGGAMYSLLLCVSDDDLSTEQFYDRYVRDAYERTNRDGWLSIHRAKFEGNPVFEKRYAQSKPNASVKRGMSSRNILTTGEQAFTVNLREEFIEASLTTDELLSVLPLNLFLPDLESEKKEILMENNEDIKEQFEIRHLTDWANSNYTIEEIGKYLQQEYFPEDDPEFWNQNAEKIVEEASDVQDALS
jgi:hypothetical protein